MSKKRSQTSTPTRDKILQVASDLFVKKGFEGTSVSEIAKEANINQSLIYHYFPSKAELWKCVKASFVEAFVDESDLILDSKHGLKFILSKIVHTRYNFYVNHPEVIRMMGWQKLEAPSEKEKIVGGTVFSPDNWQQIFKELQQQGKIRPEIDIDMMILFVSSVISGSFTEDHLKFNKQKKLNYLEKAVDWLVLAVGAEK